ncbi:MAG: GNAT family N-acetyltransferase [Candidatus Uhrbacteria bacterium]
MARQVFTQYGQLALLAQEKSAELASEFLTEGGETKIDAVAVEQELLDRAKNFLVEISRTDNVSAEAVAEKLRNYETDMVVFAGIFKTAFKNPSEVKFDEVRGLSFEQKTAAEIAQDEHQTEHREIVDIFQANWRKQKPKAAARLTQGLEAKLKTENQASRFAILKKDGKIIAFVRFDKTQTPDGRPALYCASLNVKTNLRSSALGEAVLKNTIDHEAQTQIIYADVFPDLLAGTKYVEDFGCTIVGVGEFATDESDKKEQRLLLRRDDEKNKGYAGKQKIPAAEIISQPPTGTQLEKVDTVDPEAFLKTVKKMEMAGMIGTRYFSDSANPRYRYILFEADSAEPVPSAAEAAAA